MNLNGSSLDYLNKTNEADTGSIQELRTPPNTELYDFNDANENKVERCMRIFPITLLHYQITR